MEGTHMDPLTGLILILLIALVGLTFLAWDDAYTDRKDHA